PRHAPRARQAVQSAHGRGAARGTVRAQARPLAKGGPLMSLDAYDRSIDLLRTLSPLFASIAARDASLADQLQRAAQSVPLNIAEGARRTGRDRANRFRIAMGSAAEVTAA